MFTRITRKRAWYPAPAPGKGQNKENEGRAGRDGDGWWSWPYAGCGLRGRPYLSVGVGSFVYLVVVVVLGGGVMSGFCWWRGAAEIRFKEAGPQNRCGVCRLASRKCLARSQKGRLSRTNMYTVPDIFPSRLGFHHFLVFGRLRV